jgi:hypothetical protein
MHVHLYRGNLGIFRFRGEFALKKVIVEIKTEKPKGIEIYLEEVLSTLSKNNFFSIKKFTIKTIEENRE